GNGTITATCTANTLTATRVGTITISGTGVSSQQATVTQSGLILLSVTPSNRDVGAEAGSTTFTISSNTSWVIADDADWLSVSAANGSGNGTITATCTANTLIATRVGTITISGTGVSSQQVTVTQTGIIYLSVTPSNRDVGTKAGSTTFTINSNTSWTIAEDADWLTISAVSSGDGNGTITATHLTNTSAKARVGIITVSGTGVSSQQVTVKQRANLKWDLRQNYPNPFTHVTTFDFFVPEPSQVEINIFNINGIILCILLNEKLEYGWYSIDWIPPKSLKSGIYFYQLRTDSPKATKKMLYIKQ
ncbi:MAG: BACON domain-containing carbohydrate-binding protein, partial [Bacteroidales bacterium]